MKNELKTLVMSLVALAIFLALSLLVVACQDDHVTNIVLPSDTLPAIIVCDTICAAPPDTVFCYREKKDDRYTFVCEAERRDDP